MGWKPDYATLADGRDHLRIGTATDTVDDAEIAAAITAASRAIDRSCHRQFGNTGSTSTTRTYTARHDRERGKYTVEVDDIWDDDGLTLTVSDVAVTDFTLRPYDAEKDGKPYTLIVFGGTVATTEGAIEVTTTKWGWAAIPPGITEACLIQMARLIKRRDAPFGVAGSPEMGSEMRLLARLDPDVDLLCGDYRRWWGAR